jgi:hypothetical protein
LQAETIKRLSANQQHLYDLVCRYHEMINQQHQSK